MVFYKAPSFLFLGVLVLVRKLKIDGLRLLNLQVSLAQYQGPFRQYEFELGSIALRFPQKCYH